LKRKETDFVQFKLRIREGLRRRIQREAEKKKISANAEAVERLEKSFLAADDRIKDPEQRLAADERINALQQRLNEIVKSLRSGS
jgi:hypothetical protein